MARDLLENFLAYASERKAKPSALVGAAKALVAGAIRIRTGNNGLYGRSPEPVTKPAEAIGSWLKTLDNDLIGSAREGRKFSRQHEVREALSAAAEEVDRAAEDAPEAARLQRALYADALGSLTERPPLPAIIPWALASGLAGILLGILFSRKRR